jgi:hypothetical protein
VVLRDDGIDRQAIEGVAMRRSLSRWRPFEDLDDLHEVMTMRWTLLAAAVLVLSAPGVAVASDSQIDTGTMIFRLDSAMVSGGLRFGTHTQRTLLVRPGVPVSERTGGGRYAATRPLVLRAGSRRVDLREIELRISGGKGTLRAQIAGRPLSIAKLRHATISAEPGHIRIANGRLRLTLQGATALRRALRDSAITGHTMLGPATIDVTTTPRTP